MKKILFLVFIISNSFTFAQNNKTIQQNIDEANKNLQKLDSINVAFKNYNDTVAAARFTENNNRALTSFIQERSVKAKKQAYIRIGIGVGFILLLIFGLLRKKNKT